ncbi:MAG: hypothetical protein WBM12_18780 [Pseudolabrys sp.]
MTEVRFKYLHGFRDRHGHARYYFRYRGQRWSIPSPGEQGFAQAYEALLEYIKANPVPAPRNLVFLPGSLGSVIEKFMASSEYESRAETTKRNYRRILDLLREKFGTGMLRDLKPRHVKIIRNEIRDASTTTAADIAVGLISTLWDFADEERNLQLDADPTHGVKRVHKGEREHEPWPQDLIEAFMLKAKPSLRWGVRLALYTGQRRSDLVKMMWSQFDGEFIEVRQQKTDELISIPCHNTARRTGNDATQGRDDPGRRARRAAYGGKSERDGQPNAARDGCHRLFDPRAPQERGQGSCRGRLFRSRN